MAPRRRLLGRSRRAVHGAPRQERPLRRTGARATARRRPARTGSAHDVRNEANPGVRFRYRRLRCGDGERGSPLADLQFLPARGLSADAAVRRRQRRDVATAEALSVPRGRRVRHAPVVPGKGSGISLHAQTGGPTNGWTRGGRKSWRPCCAGCAPPTRRWSRSARRSSSAADPGCSRGSEVRSGSGLFLVVRPVSSPGSSRGGSRAGGRERPGRRCRCSARS